MSAPDQTSVLQFFDALTRRDFDAALAQWKPDGTWHLHGRHDMAGEYGAADYVAFLRRWFDEHPSYEVTAFSMHTYGTDVVAAHLETRNGRAPGVASGLMIFRVEDDVIAEGWAVPTSLQGTEPF